MTTRSWSSTTSCANDAEFRALCLELRTYLLECGLVRTADTGQIDLATVARPVADTAAGYDMFAFTDSLQATAPIYVKLRYGTMGNIGVFGIWMSAGTGTNGAGVLTGIIATERICGSVSWGSYVAGSYPTYICYKDGFLGVAHKVGAFVSSHGQSQNAFAISRTCNTAGAWTGDGASVYWRTTGADIRDTVCVVQALRFAATAEAYAASTSGGYCVVPHNRTAVIGTDNPVYLHWMPVPQAVPVLGLCTYVNTHYASVGTFEATLVGSLPRTYLSFGGTKFLGKGTDATASNVFGIAMLWE